MSALSRVENALDRQYDIAKKMCGSSTHLCYTLAGPLKVSETPPEVAVDAEEDVGSVERILSRIETNTDVLLLALSRLNALHAFLSEGTDQADPSTREDGLVCRGRF